MQKDEKTLLSIVIVSWNVRDLLVQSIDSIRKTVRGHSYELIVVDNNSSDDTVEFVGKRFPFVRIIQNRENRGFAFACNQGARMAAGRFLLFLNPDSEVHAGCLDYLLAELSNDPEIGMITARVNWPDGRVQKTCARRHWTLSRLLWDSWGISKLTNGSETYGGIYLPDDCYKSRCEVESLSGAFMLARASSFWEVDGFDAEFRLGGEDMDLCRRIGNAGWKLVYEPAAQVIHRGGQSKRQNPEFAECEDFLGIFRYFEKHLPEVSFRQLSFVFLIRCLLLSVPSLLEDLFVSGGGLTFYRTRSCLRRLKLQLELFIGTDRDWQSLTALVRGGRWSLPRTGN